MRGWMLKVLSWDIVGCTWLPLATVPRWVILTEDLILGCICGIFKLNNHLCSLESNSVFLLVQLLWLRRTHWQDNIHRLMRTFSLTLKSSEHHHKCTLSIKSSIITHLEVLAKSYRLELIISKDVDLSLNLSLSHPQIGVKISHKCILNIRSSVITHLVVAKDNQGQTLILILTSNSTMYNVMVEYPTRHPKHQVPYYHPSRCTQGQPLLSNDAPFNHQSCHLPIGVRQSENAA